MKLKQRLATLLPTGKKRKRILICSLLGISLLLCGFVWDWVIEFTMPVIFPFEDAVETALLFEFESIVNIDDLQTYLTEPIIAEQIAAGVHSNVSANVYNDIEIPEMTEESLGSYILRIIFDRILS